MLLKVVVEQAEMLLRLCLPDFNSVTEVDYFGTAWLALLVQFGLVDFDVDRALCFLEVGLQRVGEELSRRVRLRFLNSLLDQVSEHLVHVAEELVDERLVEGFVGCDELTQGVEAGGNQEDLHLLSKHVVFGGFKRED